MNLGIGALRLGSSGIGINMKIYGPVSATVTAPWNAFSADQYKPAFSAGGQFMLFTADAANGTSLVAGGPFPNYKHPSVQKQVDPIFGIPQDAYYLEREELNVQIASDLGPSVWNQTSYEAGK